LYGYEVANNDEIRFFKTKELIGSMLIHNPEYDINLTKLNKLLEGAK
jgi:hypothetical protein